MANNKLIEEEINSINKESYLNNIICKKKALEYALDIRKFEIELYWKRATYFWTFLAAAFAGYFLIITSDFNGNTYSELYPILLSCVGATFALSWWKVNKGSKSWQDNWEKQVDFLEDAVIGPLYKTLIINSATKKFYSVSKINLYLSSYIFYVWITIGIYHLVSYFFSAFDLLELFMLIAITLLTLFYCLIILFKATNSSYKSTGINEERSGYRIYERFFN